MTTPIEPMLAKPYKPGQIVDWTKWFIEKKYDGHRMVVHVYRVNKHPNVSLFARPRGDGRMIERTAKVNPDILDQLKKLPDGWFDGELLAGDTGTDVTTTTRRHEQTLVVFDVMRVEPMSWMGQPYHARRQGLTEIFSSLNIDERFVTLSPSISAVSEASMMRIAKNIWKDGGEGVMLKHVNSLYHEGARKDDWLKIKKVEHSVLEIIGFEPSRGTVRFPGHPFAIVKLRDAAGNETTCKTKNDEELAKFEEQFRKAHGSKLGPGVWPKDAGTVHPALGKLLMIEYPRRTRTGGYQGPVRWDRWAEKNETITK